jgi:pimeloyl-ACP methyl ester carboxylesterase
MIEDAMTTPLDPVGSREPFEERWITMSDGVELRVMSWDPVSPLSAEPMMFVAGWVSVIEGWRPLLEVLIPRRPLHYIETREKRSARIPKTAMRPTSFSVARLGEDLTTIADAVGIEPGRSVWFGSSMGANAILEAAKHDRLAARGAFLVGPNAEFRFPWWGKPIVHLPAAAYRPAKRFALWYIRNFRVDARAEPDQMKRYVRTLNAADPVRLKLSARAVLDYSVWPDLATVSAPVAIAYASSDKLHGEDEAKAIASGIPSGRAVRCPSNTYMHQAGVAKEIEDFIAELV